ncbi:MAG: glycosyltransferase [Deltaproteobacteria bacterium]|nr:glycosyltransferase [Deltaproteobacteria bacterium]
MDTVEPTVAVAIPCLDEEAAIGTVIADFRRELPAARIVVFDNGSTDRTAQIAAGLGVPVVPVKRRGKGYVVQAILETMTEEYVVIVDGDDTYPAAAVHDLLRCARETQADMVIGTRATTTGMRRLNRVGNRLLTGILNRFFRTRYRDILSGFRVVGRDFVRTIPLVTTGFEIETEMNLQALEHGMIVKEVAIGYKERPAGSQSKLRALHDGYRILLTMAILMRDHRPLRMYTLLAACLALGAAGVAAFVPPPARSLGGAALLLAAFLMFTIGLVLNAINTRFRELRLLLKRR